MENTVSSSQVAKILSQDRVEFLNRAVARPGGPVQRTTEDLTLFVDADGDDANDGRSTATPLATIQAAVDKIPDLILHNVTINVGAGIFEGFILAGKRAAQGPYLTDRYIGFMIQGTMDAPTLTTGETSGTSDGGDTRNLSDSGQSWTVNELKGKYVLIDGLYHVIESNTSDALVLVGAHAATMSGKAYSLLEPVTLLEHTGAGPAIYVDGCGEGALPVTIQQFKITKGAAYQGGVQCIQAGVLLDRITVDIPSAATCFYGFYFDYCPNASIGESSVLGNFGGGLFARHTALGGNALLIDSLDGEYGWSGVQLHSMVSYTVKYTAIHDQGETSHGMEVYRSKYVAPIELDITGSGGSGLVIATDSHLEASEGLTLAGTGNAGWGVLADGAVVDFAGVPTITGTSGNLSLDAGSTALTWATAFAADGDVETAADFLSWARRRD